MHQYSAWDFGATIFAYVGVSLPTFVLGILALILFAVRLHWLPAGGISSSVSAPTLLNHLRHLILPACVLAFYALAGESRYTRSSMLEVLHADYVRTARAKGLPERAVIYRHAFRTALIPIVTILTLDFAYLFGGTLNRLSRRMFAGGCPTGLCRFPVVPMPRHFLGATVATLGILPHPWRNHPMAFDPPLT